MAYDEGLASRIRSHFKGRTDVTERKMFSGLAFLCSGRMCCGIVGTDLMVRVPKGAYESIWLNLTFDRWISPVGR